MGDVWGNRIKLALFGESHGEAIGIVIDGLPPGEAVDLAAVAAELARRAPGQSTLTTSRKEADTVEVLSGLHHERTTGAAVCGIIRNHNARSGDYGRVLRPGHADWTALLKYGGHADMRGGGHFSGRLTAPLVFAGAIAKQILARRGVAVYGRITAIGGVENTTVLPGPEGFSKLLEKPFPVLDDPAGAAMQEAILQAKAEGDSVGGIVEVAAFGAPGGLGDPFFASVESVASSLFFSIPAVKGVEFGDGFALAGMRGSQANDALRMDGKTITAESNHNGGILGGITSGMPVVARLAIKPTPSIAQAQNSVDPDTMQDARLEIRGRHDPCIVPRALPVAEAALALALLDCMGPRGPLPPEEEETPDGGML